MGPLIADAGKLDRIRRQISDEITREAYDGMAMSVTVEDELVLDEVFGFANRGDDILLDKSHVFSVMSLTKPLTALAIFQAIERGAVSLTTRVCEVIPDFAQNGKQRVTIGQLLSHTGGMPFTLPGLRPEDEGDLDATVAAACRIAPVNRPGEVVSYSAQVSYDVLGYDVAIASAGRV